MYKLVCIWLVSVLCYNACAGFPNLEKPQPELTDEGAFFTASDQARIFVYTYVPAKAATATIYLLSGITGINHKSEQDVIQSLSAGRNRVVVIHPRGTGYSDGKRGDIDDYATIVSDYVEIINGNSRRPQGRIFLYGHSMSTAIALEVAAKLARIDGVILINPPWKLKPAKGMSPSWSDYIKYASYYLFAPHTPVVNMAGNPAQIENPEERSEAEARMNDPLLVKHFSLYMMSASQKMMQRMLTNAKAADYPLLLIYGEKDSIVERSGCDEIFEAWKNPNKTFKVVPDGPHGKKTALAAMAWITEWLARLTR